MRSSHPIKVGKADDGGFATAPLAAYPQDLNFQLARIVAESDLDRKADVVTLTRIWGTNPQSGLRRLLHRFTDVVALTRIWGTNLQSGLRRCLYECPADVVASTRIWGTNLQSGLRRSSYD